MAIIDPASRTLYQRIATPDAPFVLEDGAVLSHAEIAHETFGTLNAARDNAILLFHALTGSHHAAGNDPTGPHNEFWMGDTHLGWWDDFVGPGKAIDTDKFFVVCCNYLGGCYGSTGPASIDPETGEPFGSRFPWPSIGDIVRSQFAVLDALGIDRLVAVIGASVGGLCALDAATRYPGRLRGCIVIGTALRSTVLTKAHNFEQIYAIQEDPDFNGGDYYAGPRPWRGLCLARIISHKTYVSLHMMEKRARAELVQPTDLLCGYQIRHRIESYLLHQGKKFVERFDANAYLRIINAWQNFDLTAAAGGDAAATLATCKGQRWLVVSISGDVCFYPDEQAEIVDALKANGIDHSYVTVHSEKGHDSFLLEPALYTPQIAYALGQLAAG